MTKLDKARTLAAACAVHLAIGSVYAESVLADPIARATGWPSWVPTVGFALTILALGLAAAVYRNLFAGESLRHTLVTCTVIGTLATSGRFIVTPGGYPPGVDLSAYLLACLAVGAATGVLYAGTVNRVATVFAGPHLGKATGAVVMAFGLGSLAAASWYRYAEAEVGPDGLLINAAAYLVVVWAATVVVTTFVLSVEADEVIAPTATPTELLGNLRWRWTAITAFANIAVGVALLGRLAPLAADAGMTDAAWLVAVAGLANGLGRILTASLGDRFTRTKVLMLALDAQLLGLIALQLIGPSIFPTVALLVVAVYGGVFAILPGVCADLLGDHAPSGYAGVLAVWGFAGVVGPAALAAGNLAALTILAAVAAGAAIQLNHVSRDV